MRPFILASTLLFVAFLPSCRFADGYQPGDIILTVADAYRAAKTAQFIYCNSTDPEDRQQAIAVLQGMGIEYGQEGFCGLTLSMQAK